MDPYVAIHYIQPSSTGYLFQSSPFLWPGYINWSHHQAITTTDYCPPKKIAPSIVSMEIIDQTNKTVEGATRGLTEDASQVQSSSSTFPLPLLNACDDHWSWNPKDLSHEVRLSGPKHRIAHFHPNWSNGTAGVRGTRALNKGRFYWEINVSQRIFGTSMMFGVGTKKARLHVDAFVNMLGEDDQSWGLSHKGFLWHAGKHRQYTKPFRENVATTVGIFFDGINGTITYYKDGVSLGVAFTGLDEVSESLYPIVCSTAAKTEMSLGIMKREFISIQDRCRAVILRQLTHENQIEELELPRTLKQFILEGLSEDTQEDMALSQNNLNHHSLTS